MTDVWMEHPNLPLGQDIKVPRGALGSYAACGWQVRADQSDPAPEVDLADLLLAEDSTAATEESIPSDTATKPSPTTRKG